MQNNNAQKLISQIVRKNNVIVTILLNIKYITDM